MQVHSFYSSFEADLDGFYSVAELSELPLFCRPVLKDGDASRAAWIDGWTVEPTGDFVADMTTGRQYAELAVAYARSKADPGFIEFVLSAMNIKTLIAEITPGGIEYGFFHRIAEIAYCGSMN